MKKKILVALLAAIMAVAMLPSLAFAVPEEPAAFEGAFDINGFTVYSDDTYVGDSALPGGNWTYADGVLTLDGFQGNRIYVWPYMTTNSGTLTIVLKGENIINMTGGDGIQAEYGNVIFQGTGTLDITGFTFGSAIWIKEGTVTFDLGIGGEVRMDPVLEIPSQPKVEEDPLTNDSVEAIIAYYRSPYEPTGSVDQIILNAGNVITRPDGGLVSLYTWSLDNIEQLDAKTPVVPSVDTKAAGPELSVATIKATPDSAPAEAVTITGVAVQEEEPVPTPDPVVEPTAADPTKPAGTVSSAKTPKTGDDSLLGVAGILMVVGAVGAIGLAKRKFD